MSSRTYKLLSGLLILIFLYGCAGGTSGGVKSQAIQPQDKNLSRIENNLVFLVVNIKQPRARLKLRNFVAKNLSSQKNYSFAFFDNFILGSSPLQHTVTGNTVEHLIFLDLPAGTYSISNMQFFDFQYRLFSRNTTAYLDYVLYKPVKFEVLPNGATDLGQLNIEIIQATQTSVEANAYAQLFDYALTDTDTYAQLQSDYGLTNAYYQVMAGTIHQLKGILNFTTPGHRKIDLRKAMGRYPALKEQVFQKGKMWVVE